MQLSPFKNHRKSSTLSQAAQHQLWTRTRMIRESKEDFYGAKEEVFKSIRISKQLNMQMTNIFMSPKTSLMISPSSVRKLGFATENSQSKLKLPVIKMKNSHATI